MSDSTPKYLVAVDDEDDLRFLFEHFFKKQIQSKQLELIFRTSANECISALENIQGEIVLLSDICMPDMDGIELLKIVKSKFPATKVLLVSAYDKDKYLDDMQKWGAVDYISKPVDFDQLRSKVLKLLDISH